MPTETRKYEKKARAEGEEQTRQKIAAAAAELHSEVGPSATTVAEIARRAGVSRLTVYNHFPDNEALYPACSAHWIAEHPLPDFSKALAAADPRERVRELLQMTYTEVFRGWGGMMGNLQRDRAKDPALDAYMGANTDPMFDRLGAELAKGFAARGAKAERLRALTRLALDFWTWRRLDAEGFSDSQAAELMGDSIAAVAAQPGPAEGRLDP
jgi:AcrR family transcriptional regulator